tara:strand:- start:233 stop:553 length:321 start_codon:yes stop_codon:yes gene_type:complete
MAKGKASVSASGASMSKYDVEVESRLKALEAQAHPVPTGASSKLVNDRLANLEEAVVALQKAIASAPAAPAPAPVAAPVPVDQETLTKVVEIVKHALPKWAGTHGL